MLKFITIALLATVTTACMPAGGGSGEAHTGWRGLLSAGPASEDGAVKCGVPRAEFFTCADGASVERGEFWMGCALPGQADIGGNGAQAAGDFVLFDRGGRVFSIGRADGATVTRAICLMEGAPVPRAWVGWVAEIRQGFPKVEEVCWHPDTGASADCAEMGR